MEKPLDAKKQKSAKTLVALPFFSIYFTPLNLKKLNEMRHF